MHKSVLKLMTFLGGSGGFVKQKIVFHWNNVKLRQDNGCCNLKIFTNRNTFAFVCCNHRFKGILVNIQ